MNYYRFITREEVETDRGIEWVPGPFVYATDENEAQLLLDEIYPGSVVVGVYWIIDVVHTWRDKALMN